MSSRADSLRRGAEGLREALPTRGGATPPEDTARRLATLYRTAHDGSAEELRVSWAEYEGRPYVSVRFWIQGSAGGWWPSKGRGFTIRLRELPEFAEGIAAALELVREHAAVHGSPSSPGTL